MTTFTSVSLPQIAPPDPSKHVDYQMGMVLGVDDFVQEFAYSSGRDKRIVRDLIGYGVVSGLRVTIDVGTATGPQVQVAPGELVTPSGPVRLHLAGSVRQPQRLAAGQSRSDRAVRIAAAVIAPARGRRLVRAVPHRHGPDPGRAVPQRRRAPAAVANTGQLHARPAAFASRRRARTMRSPTSFAGFAGSRSSTLRREISTPSSRSCAC